MKTLIKSVFILGVFGLLFASCEDFLDINEDPDTPSSEEVTEEVYLPGVLGRWAYNGISLLSIDVMYMNAQITREGAAVGGGMWGNYLTPANAGNPWNLYTNLLKHSTFLHDMASDNGNRHYQGIAGIISAWSLATITDHYGSIPCEEAIMFPEITQPRFDSQEVVYNKVFELLDDAITHLGASAAGQDRLPGNDDLVFSGDIDKWIRLAYSLKARYNMRLSYAPGKSATAQADLVLNALSSGMRSSEDDAVFRHYSGTGFQSGFYEFGKNWTDVMALTPSIFIVETILEMNDPRVPVYFTLDAHGEYSGWVSGRLFEPANHPSRISDDFVDPTYPETFMNYVECKMLEAEAYALKSMFDEAEQAYNQAVIADMEGLGIEEASITQYLDQFTFPGNVEEAQEMIILQKYISNYITNFEMHFDFIRTGYPVINFAENIEGAESATTVPRRFPYPTAEKDRNPNTPDNTFNPITTKVWWDNK